MALRVVLFLIINFSGLALGALYTGVGTRSEWYTNLDIAPWTPPGWVFGVAWTSIMICFAFYMAFMYEASNNRKLLIGLFALQWVLNFAWNPVFFKFHAIIFGLIIIISLTILVAHFLFSGFELIRFKSLLVLPYFLWLCIATSLNAYISLTN